ncbi:MAG: phage major capsid protein [Oscillospiraceae bacterium]|nr:phage major capsid protein [Oscillospiraceae bacterium]
MATKSNMSTNFKAEMVRDIFSKVKGHSTIVKLAQQMPVAFSGNDIMTFNLDGEVAIVGEGGQKPAGEATIAPVTVVPVKVVYQHRVSDEFLRVTEEKALKMLEAFRDGFAKKIARGIDIMSFHGVNPADLEASSKIGDNHLDSKAKSVTYTAGKPEDALTDAIALIGDYDVTGYALSKSFAADLGNYKENGVSQYPEFKMGANPGKLVGTACDVNSTVTKGNDKALAYVGDFQSAFRWGYADQIPMEVIQYGDPDGQGDLKRSNEVVLRAEAWIGWGILDGGAFARVVKGT